MKVTIYHNPRCSKSRQTLALLQDRGIEPQIIEYLKTPLNREQLGSFLSAMNMPHARDLMRQAESEYADNNLSDESLSEQQLLQSMVDNPILIQRPIVVVEDENETKVALGRPIEDVINIL